MTTAYEYVVEIMDLTQATEEDKAAYLQRVAFEIQSLSEIEWNEMPVELQEWYNKTADMLAALEEDGVPEFVEIPGMSPPATKAKGKKLPAKKVEPVKAAEVDDDEEAAVAEGSDNEESTVEESAAPKKRGRKPGTKVAAKEKVVKEKVVKEPRGPIAANAVREILCEDITTTLDQLMEKLEERGIPMMRSSAQVVHLNTVRAFEVAIEVGNVSKSGTVVLTKA